IVKIVEEPAHTVREESSQETEVYLSAVVGYAQFKLSTIVVHLNDTLPFETSTATFRMDNTGKVALQYFWEEAADYEPVSKPYSTTLMRQLLSSATVKKYRKLVHSFWWQQGSHFKTHPSELRRLQELAKQQQDSKQQQPSEQQQQEPEQQQQEQSKQQQDSKQKQSKQKDRSKKLRRSKQKQLSLERVSSSLEIFPDIVHDVPLFSIDPDHGTIAPGQQQTFQVLFSPKCVGNFEITMLCSIPNLEPSHRRVRVILKGRARDQKSFDREKRSALRQAEEGQRPKKQVRWQPTPE
ncbi:probable serine/threonine-protein kinase DDB_G0280133, partial [Cyanistes caeruleus]|uniref:probable serine/threonine-protein kinase DDB_G0280133 n=1 Tax=Cyanistes caeruleus TaxID=156563 RepID=UPI000CDB8529